MNLYSKRIPVTVQVALKYGFFSALLLCVVLVSLYYTDKHPLLIPVIYDVRILLLALFIFFAIKDFRDNKNGGEAHFWQGMIIGLLVAIFLGMFTAFGIMLFGVIEQDFLSSYIELTMSQLTSNKDLFIESIGVEVYEKNLQNLPSTTLSDLALDYYLKTVAIGLFLTIIISIILRRQTKQQL